MFGYWHACACKQLGSVPCLEASVIIRFDRQIGGELDLSEGHAALKLKPVSIAPGSAVVDVAPFDTVSVRQDEFVNKIDPRSDIHMDSVLSSLSLGRRLGVDVTILDRARQIPAPDPVKSYACLLVDKSRIVAPQPDRSEKHQVQILGNPDIGLRIRPELGIKIRIVGLLGADLRPAQDHEHEYAGRYEDDGLAVVSDQRGSSILVTARHAGRN